MIAVRNQKTKIIHGACDDEVDVVGATVGSIRASLVDAFNLYGDVAAFVNGVRVDFGYRLSGGETLEFCKPWGTKGSDSPLNEAPLPFSDYETIDITSGIPAGLVHVDQTHLGPTCKRIGIEYGKAVVSWAEFARRRSRKRYPILSGVVIRRTDHARLMQALADKEAARRKKVARLPVLAALFSLNRRAKRCRDLAQTYYQNGMHGFAGKMRREKERIYDLKGQVLHYMIEAGVLVGGKLHRFGFGNWAEILVGGGYTFHRPCPLPDGDNAGVELIESIEAKPKGTKEPTLKVAYEAVEKYLEGKERASVYQWPRINRGRIQRLDNDDIDDGDDDDDDEW